MPIRWYLSPYTGGGSFDNPIHAKCWDYTDQTQNQCTGTRMPQRQEYLVRVNAPQAIHDAIVANDAGTVISPMYADEAAEASALDAEFTDATYKAAVDGKHYSTSWMTTGNTFRDMLRYVVRMCHLGQRLHKFGPVVTRVMELGLSSTVADLTAAQRTAVRNWMTNHGLATGWITNGTTIRQVLHFILTNLGFGKHHIGKLEF